MSEYRPLGLAAAATAACLAIAGSASSAPVYMTGIADPWEGTSNDRAMDAAFGAGSWLKFQGFDAAAIAAADRGVLYLDGGGDASEEFDAFVGAHRTDLEAFVIHGGALFLNAARWTYTPLEAPFDGRLLNPEYALASWSGALTAEGETAGLSARGAGSTWNGNYFSHDLVTGGEDCFVTGEYGCVLSFAREGAGVFLLGSQSGTEWHWDADAAFQLRVNELLFLAQESGVVPTAPALPLLLFGVGGALVARRR